MFPTESSALSFLLNNQRYRISSKLDRFIARLLRIVVYLLPVSYSLLILLSTRVTTEIFIGYGFGRAK